MSFILIVVFSLLRAFFNSADLDSQETLKVFAILAIASLHVAAILTAVLVAVFRNHTHVLFFSAVVLFGIYSFFVDVEKLAHPTNNDPVPGHNHHGGGSHEGH